MAEQLPAPRVRLRVDGRIADVPAGITLAAAILGLERKSTRRDLSGRPRAPLCGMGTCFECRATVDGRAHVRTCRVLVTDGMEVRRG